MLLGTGLVVLKFKSAVNRKGLRWLAAGLMTVTGLLVAFGPWLAHAIDHPTIQLLADCVTT